MGAIPFASNLYQIATRDAPTQRSIERVVQGAYTGPAVAVGEEVCRGVGGAEPKLAVQGGHKGICKLPQLARRQLGASGNVGGVEGDDIIGGDEGLVERGQQMGKGSGVKVRQHLQQIRHGPRVLRAWRRVTKGGQTFGGAQADVPFRLPYARRALRHPPPHSHSHYRYRYRYHDSIQPPRFSPDWHTSATHNSREHDRRHAPSHAILQPRAIDDSNAARLLSPLHLPPIVFAAPPSGKNKSLVHSVARPGSHLRGTV